MNTFGYTEMYEWETVPDNEQIMCRFVQLSDTVDNYHKIRLATSDKDVIGVTAIIHTCISDDPDEWFLKYAFNRYGMTYYQQKTIKVGHKEYDSINEIPYIKTNNQQIYDPIISNDYDPQKTYVKRSNRIEWAKVNLIGKCIVTDNGQCKAGGYCKLYDGQDKTKFGIAIPANINDTCNKWKILYRVSETTILILYK